MTDYLSEQPHVKATVVEVLPAVGLAYLDGDDQRSWTVTRCTRGTGLSTLQKGSRVALTVQHYPEFSLVSEYSPLN